MREREGYPLGSIREWVEDFQGKVVCHIWSRSGAVKGRGRESRRCMNQGDAGFGCGCGEVDFKTTRH
jgi:hypothetical protein